MTALCRAKDLKIALQSPNPETAPNPKPYKREASELKPLTQNPQP